MQCSDGEIDQLQHAAHQYKSVKKGLGKDLSRRETGRDQLLLYIPFVKLSEKAHQAQTAANLNQVRGAFAQSEALSALSGKN